MNLAVVFTKSKPQYGPIGDAILKTSKRLDFDIKFHGDDLRGYKNIIILDTKIQRIKKSILCDKDAKVGWLMGDLRSTNVLPASKIADQITHIFLCNKEYIDDYKRKFNKEVFYMPQCGHELDMKKGREIEAYVVFIGNLTHIDYHYNRGEILDLMGRIGLKHISGEKTSYDQAYLYNKTPISLSVSLPKEGYTSNRLYNILASGGFALVKYFPGIKDLFSNREHLVWFKTPQQALRLAQEYLDDKKERDRIARNGYKLFLEKHRAEHRIRNMVDIMNGVTNQFYGYKWYGSSIS